MLRNRLALGCWRLLENRCQCCWWRGCWCCRSCWRSSRRWWREGKQPGLVCSSWPKSNFANNSVITWSLMTMRLVLNIKVPFLPVQLSAFLRCTALAEVKHFSVWQMFLLWCTHWQLWLGRVCVIKMIENSLPEESCVHSIHSPSLTSICRLMREMMCSGSCHCVNLKHRKNCNYSPVSLLIITMIVNSGSQLSERMSYLCHSLWICLCHCICIFSGVGQLMFPYHSE